MGKVAAHIAPDAPATIDLHGLSIHAISEQSCIAHILDSLDAGAGGWVVTPNLDILRRCSREGEVRMLLHQADLRVADGMPLIWASRLQGTPLPERVAGSSLISTLSAAAAERGRTVFLLGGEPGAAEGAAAVLRDRHSNVRIAGIHCPPMGFERDEAQMGEIRKALLAARPDIVYVALGSPKQERLIRELRPLLPQAWWIGVGISFSFLCGRVKRAPLWMQRIGLEWVHRLAQEPRRLARRYLVEGLPFAVAIMAGALRRRWSGSTQRQGASG